MSGSCMNAVTTAILRFTPRLISRVGMSGSRRNVSSSILRCSSLRTPRIRSIMRRNAVPVMPAGSAISPGR